jgi:hypothetical protein
MGSGSSSSSTECLRGGLFNNGTIGLRHRPRATWQQPRPCHASLLRRPRWATSLAEMPAQKRSEQVSTSDGVQPAAAPVPNRTARFSSRFNRRPQLRAAAIWLPGVGLVGVKWRDRLTRPLRTGIPAASPPPRAPFHEIGRPAERVSRVPGIANGGCMDGPRVPRHRRRCQQRRNNQRRANKSEFHHGLLPLCRVTRLVFATPDRFGARANYAIRFLFQFAAQPAQIAVMAAQTQVGAAGFSFPGISGRHRE